MAISFLNQDTDVQLVNASSTIVGSMTGNAFYPSPLPTLVQIATAHDAFAAAVNALDRSKTATVRRDQTRLALVQLLRELSLYVQQASGGDPAKLLSSGFPMQRKRGAPPSELQPAKSLRVRQSAVSGRLLARCTAVVGAKSYQWRIATALAPATWTTSDTVTVARFTFDNLVPGTQYLVQVRAFAASGPSNWSDSVAKFSN
ncbi:MAG TPA: fibronectin type III domain-containing protein [Xanthomonadaceae bacterium]|nr:fibronectin type III domain-containing protein [Xanthomonadaceae bacterium]